MHALGRTDDRIDGTRVQTQRAADAPRLVDSRDREWHVLAVGTIEGQGGAAGQRRQRGDQGVASGWAAIDRVALRDGSGVRPARIVAATPALGLRQQRIDTAD